MIGTAQTSARQVEVFDERVCQLGESPLWHPLREELFWVDLPANRLLRGGPASRDEWQFDDMVSAIAWHDRDHLLLARESGLHSFDIVSGTTQQVCSIEADDASRRANDGRADPWGGFWISTMSKSAAHGQGQIYRWYRGELSVVVTTLSIPNGICFDRTRCLAYFADSAEKCIYSMALNEADGSPSAKPALFADLTDCRGEMDGAVVDAEGCMWSAQWDGACVTQLSPPGARLARLNTGAVRPTCTAFGGEVGRDLYITTAAIGLQDDVLAKGLNDGATLRIAGGFSGLLEPRVDL